jgi:hypothetical protein
MSTFHRCRLVYMSNHKIKYWVYAGGELMRHSRNMVGFKMWEASCSCGWKTRTGGAIQSYIKREVQWHKWEHNKEVAA